MNNIKVKACYIARNEITGRERKFNALDAAKAYFSGAKFRGAEFDRIEFSDETSGDGSRCVAVYGFFDQPDFKNCNRQIGIIDIDDGADEQ